MPSGIDNYNYRLLPPPPEWPDREEPDLDDDEVDGFAEEDDPFDWLVDGDAEVPLDWPDDGLAEDPFD
jgi:hypothetical protein